MTLKAVTNLQIKYLGNLYIFEVSYYFARNVLDFFLYSVIDMRLIMKMTNTEI